MSREFKSTKELLARAFLDKMVGDGEVPSNFQDPTKQEASAEVVDSPIDLLAGAAGAKLGSAMVKDAGAVLGNQIGAIGRDITKSPQTHFSKLREQLVPILEKKGVLGKGKFEDEALIAKELENIAQRGIETGKAAPALRDVAMQKTGQAERALERNIAQTSDIRSQKQATVDEINRAREELLKKMSGR